MDFKRLKAGCTIGLTAPSGALKPDDIKKGEEFLISKGFKIKEGKHIYDKHGYLAGLDKNRASDLMDMFTDDSIDMILCVRGGYGAMRILPLIDFDVIKKHPKIFTGFSDITALLNSIAKFCGFVTFHGPMLSSNLNDNDTYESFITALSNPSNDADFNLVFDKDFQFSNPYCLVEGEASGKIVGGNLSLVCATLGTPYEIDTDSNILFLEDVNEDPYKVDRLLTHLLLAGKLQKCSGIILGQYTGCELPHYERSLTLDEVFDELIVPLNKPTICHFMSGHSYPKLTFPIGAKAYMNSSKPEIRIKY